MTRKKQQRLLPLVLLLTVGFAFLHSMTWAQDSVTSIDIPIEFSGIVEYVSADVAIIDQLPINITAETSNNALQPGQVVSVRGKLQPDGSILAGAVDVLEMNVIAPTLLSQAPPSAETVSDTSAIPLCPLAPDDWKAAADRLPAAALSLGGQDYSQAELIALLNAEPSSDASLSLARELVAAHFNILNGADATEYYDSLFEADALLVRRGESQDRLPYGVDPVSSGGQQMLNTAALLSEFNVGQNAADCQAAPSQSEVLPTITVEGLVESVTANGLVVNGLNILLDHSNASLASVQAGDYVRIEGVLVGQNSADMRVMPVNVRVDRATPVEVIPTAQPIVDSPPQDSVPASVNSEPVNPPPANPPPPPAENPPPAPPPAPENPPPAPPANPPPPPAENPPPAPPPPPENPPPVPPANPPDNGGRGDEGMGMGRDGGGHNGDRNGGGNGEGMGMGMGD